MLRHLSRIVDFLFDDSASRDLELVVSGVPFRGHRAVLVPVSGYLERFVRWPSDAGGGDSSVRIELPAIAVPEAFADGDDFRRRTGPFWFELYLKMVYGRYRPRSKQRVGDLLAIVQVADFMISPSIVTICDEHLSASCAFGPADALHVVRFCQRYALPKTATLAKQLVADHLADLRHDPCLYQVELALFAEIVQLCHDTSLWPFWIILCYGAGDVPVNDFVCKVLHIDDPETARVCRELVAGVSRRWPILTIDRIYKHLRRREVRIGGDCAFLYQVIAEAYYAIRAHSCKQIGTV